MFVIFEICLTLCNCAQLLWVFEVGWPIAIISVVAIFHALIGTYEFQTCKNLHNYMATVNTNCFCIYCPRPVSCPR